MKFLIRLIPILFLLCFAGKCNSGGQDYLNADKAASYLFGKKHPDSILWEHVQTMDPYQEGTLIPTEAGHFLELDIEGNFRMWDPENKSHGKYFLDKKKKAMAFVYESMNGETPHSSMQEMNFSHRIQRLESDTMVLAWQGRHGWVEEMYKRVEKEN